MLYIANLLYLPLIRTVVISGMQYGWIIYKTSRSGSISGTLSHETFLYNCFECVKQGNCKHKLCEDTLMFNKFSDCETAKVA